MKYPTGNVRGMLCLTCLTLASALWLDIAAAEMIYKTVDGQGNVTFSNTPPPPGANAQQIELQPGPTPAEQRQSTEELQNLENEANEMGSGNTASQPPPQEEQPVQPTTEYQQDSSGSSGDEEPAVIDDGYVGDRDEVARDRVEDRRDLPGPAVDAPRPATRAR